MSGNLGKADLCRGNKRNRNTVTNERRQRRRTAVDPREHAQATETVEIEEETEYRSLSLPEYICSRCNAIMWYEERVKQTSTKRHTNFNLCCKDGRIRLEQLKDPPEFLQTLLSYNGSKDSVAFQKLIRVYNACYTFTSMGAKIDNTVNMRPGPYVFRISGQVYHRIGPLLPSDEQGPAYLQFYVYDTDTEIKMRSGAVSKQEDGSNLDERILTGLKSMLDEVNPLSQTFRMAQKRIKDDPKTSFSIRLLGTRQRQDRTYNSPAASEIAALIVGGDAEDTYGRDIIVEYKGGGLKTISELHPSYMALQYPLLFPYGEDNFHIKIPYSNEGQNATKKQIKRGYVTMREYYAYRIQQRLTEGQTLLRGGRLFQQFIVDCCCAMETERLWYIKRNQPFFRCEMLNNLCDAFTKGDYLGASVGKRIFLPASFTGSRRYMQQYYQDAMAICRWYGNPHLFITFTANPKWPEVTAMLNHIEGQKIEDRPDIMARVFKLKLRQLMDCLKKDNYFGPVVADVYTIEFQKRGLPHAHILLWLQTDNVQVSTQYIDSIIHAELPNKDKQPRLYEAVSRHMVHGPCGEDDPSCPCMVNDTCSKKYPKQFNEETSFDSNGYPIYRRRLDNRSVKKRKAILDNRSIVPYNPGLLLMFDSHINVEWCNTARAIKYLFKYISKGADKATMLIKRNTEDEVQAYLDCRYLSASEAAWRIFEFDIQERNPSVARLPVHLKGEQAVVLKDFDDVRVVIEDANETETMLTAWMSTNAKCEETRTLTYAQFPTKYVWKENQWERRKQGKCIGRMAYVHPTAGERYYLRLLLNIVKGSTSFEDIRTIDKTVYPTYKDACYAYGLLSNDKEWNDAMEEANKWAMPAQLRELFVTMLLFCEVTDTKAFWEASYDMVSDDIERIKRKQFGHPGLELSDEAKRSYTLIEIDKVLLKYGKRLKDIQGMPQPDFTTIEGMENKLIREERMYNTRSLTEEWQQKCQQLNSDQLKVYEAVVEAVRNEGNSGSDNVYFLYGHGGTGKTFLYTTISAKVRSENKIVLNVASSGIAALLLPGGRTAHSRLQIPIELFENSTCNISQGTQLAELLRQTSLIIWDEAPMDHRFAFESLDRTLRDIVGYEDPEAKSKMFGGKVVLLGGDFRQVLPIVAKGTRQDIVRASLNRSYIWNSCRVFVLKQSMRVRETDPDMERVLRNKRFNEWLIAMGDGRLEAKAEEMEDEATWVKIPDEYICGKGSFNIETAVNEIYPDFEKNRLNNVYLRERAILTPLNDTADIVNDYMTGLIPGDYTTYKSSDEICPSSTECDDQLTAYPVEYLNTLKLQGLPNHELKLKEGMPVMLLRNINPTKGLCNGTRLIINRLGKFIVTATIITGSQVGRQVIIPRIVMTSSEHKIPFILKRRQYPLKPCYAMTINKSQGQSLTYVGVFLPKPVFSHGQLYVAASRTTSPEGLKFFIDDSKQKYKGHTRNIVYREVFMNLPEVL